MPAARVSFWSLVILLGAASGGPRGIRMVDLNEASAGKPVTLAVGEKVRITLEESGGTGYRWDGGTSCASLLRPEEVQREIPNTTPGASRRRVWVYTAQAEGACDLRFELARSWDKTANGKTIVFPFAVRR